MEWEALAWVQWKALKERGINYCFEGIIPWRALVFPTWETGSTDCTWILLCFAMGRASGRKNCHSLACFLTLCSFLSSIALLDPRHTVFWMWMKRSTLAFETLWKMLWCFCFSSKVWSSKASGVLILICWNLSVSTSDL